MFDCEAENKQYSSDGNPSAYYRWADISAIESVEVIAYTIDDESHSVCCRLKPCRCLWMHKQQKYANQSVAKVVPRKSIALTCFDTIELNANHMHANILDTENQMNVWIKLWARLALSGDFFFRLPNRNESASCTKKKSRLLNYSLCLRPSCIIRLCRKYFTLLCAMPSHKIDCNSIDEIRKFCWLHLRNAKSQSRKIDWMPIIQQHRIRVVFNSISIV